MRHAFFKNSMWKKWLYDFQVTVLPSISPPEEDIVLRFRNAVPIASSLVSRSLQRANGNCRLSHCAVKFTCMRLKWSSYQSYMVSLTHSHMDGNWKQTETEACVKFWQTSNLSLHFSMNPSYLDCKICELIPLWVGIFFYDLCADLKISHKI